MPKTMIVTEKQISLSPSTGKVGGLESMHLMPNCPYVIYLDSKAHHYARVHSHSEPEIMVVVTGHMIFNGVWCGVGSVIHVPANEEYWYATGDERCMVVLARFGDRGVITLAREEPAFETEHVVIGTPH